MTSTARSDMRFASSWMVIISGSTISLAIFSLDSEWPPPLSRWVRRRNAATERVRSSSAEVAVATVRRPRSRGGPLREGRGAGIIGLAGAAGISTRVGRTGSRRGVSTAGVFGRGAGAAAAGEARGRKRRGGGLRRNGNLAHGGGRRGFAAGEATARLLFRLLLEIGFLQAALIFLALARLGGVALGLLALLALAADGGLGLLTAAVLLLLGAGVVERAGAGLALLFRKRLQDDAGARRGRARR